jgi:hypothetical protein
LTKTLAIGVMYTTDLWENNMNKLIMIAIWALSGVFALGWLSREVIFPDSTISDWRVWLFFVLAAFVWNTGFVLFLAKRGFYR